jgi:predicted nucleic-acid-binding Zn-ribbon protein
MSDIDRMLLEEFSCPKCEGHEAFAERLAMSGTGFSRFVDIQHREYAFVTCANCGYTEVHNLRVLRDLRRG